MIRIFGTIVVVALWLYTLKIIINSDKEIVIKIACIIAIIVFPFIGVFYPIYYFIKKRDEQVVL